MIQSKNPYTGELLEEHQEMSSKDIDHSLDQAVKTFEEWRTTSFDHRADLMRRLAKELKENKKFYATTMTEEMGKPISQSLAEIEKCAWVCDYYAENAERQLSEEEIETDAKESYVSYEPLGTVLAVMPWNYPFWQVFRFAAPALMAGNVAVLKHASNVMMCAKNLEKIFSRAGFPKGCFQNLLIGSSKVEQVIQDERVKAVTLTGSGPAGKAVASTAGKEIKKSVLELGGSNALVVFEDADIDHAVQTCVQARFQNTGQSCIAGKRLLVQERIAEIFIEKFIAEVKALKVGDPLDENTFIGVLAREDLAEELYSQVRRSQSQGAQVLMGGKRERAFFEPTVLANVTPDMPVFSEETFGPAIGVSTFKNEAEAIDLVNRSIFGLGVSLFTSDIARAKILIPKFEDGAVFINDLVKSDPRLPFGGTKKSGYGRELSVFGIKEFVNIKTVYIKE